MKYQRFLGLLFIILGAGAMGGCEALCALGADLSGTAMPEDAKLTITGTVLDETGAPVENQRVLLMKHSIAIASFAVMEAESISKLVDPANHYYADLTDDVRHDIRTDATGKFSIALEGWEGNIKVCAGMDGEYDTTAAFAIGLANPSSAGVGVVSKPFAFNADSSPMTTAVDVGNLYLHSSAGTYTDNGDGTMTFDLAPLPTTAVVSYYLLGITGTASGQPVTDWMSGALTSTFDFSATIIHPTVTGPKFWIEGDTKGFRFNTASASFTPPTYSVQTGASQMTCPGDLVKFMVHDPYTNRSYSMSTAMDDNVANTGDEEFAEPVDAEDARSIYFFFAECARRQESPMETDVVAVNLHGVDISSAFLMDPDTCIELEYSTTTHGYQPAEICLMDWAGPTDCAGQGDPDPNWTAVGSQICGPLPVPFWVSWEITEPGITWLRARLVSKTQGFPADAYFEGISEIAVYY